MPLDLGEAVVRAVLWPRVVESASGLISQEQIVAPLPKKFDGGLDGFALSVGRLTMLPDDASVHDFGIRVAGVANAYTEAKEGRPLVLLEETVHYRGSYDIEVDDVRKITSDVFDIDVEHVPENGLDEHCDIDMRARSADISKNKRKGGRSYVMAQLMLLLKNPRPHIAAADAGIAHILEKIELPDYQAHQANP